MEIPEAQSESISSWVIALRNPHIVFRSELNRALGRVVDELPLNVGDPVMPTFGHSSELSLPGRLTPAASFADLVAWTKPGLCFTDIP